MATKSLPVSPAGEAGYLHIAKPNTKFNADGEFSADLILEGDAAEQFKAELTAAAEAGRDEIVGKEKNPAKAKKLAKYNLHVPFVEETDEEGEETGRTIFRFKNKAKGKKRDGSTFNVRIPIVDSKRKEIPDASKLGRGSVIKVAYAVVPFAMDATQKIGVTLRLQAVQVIQPKWFEGGAANAFSDEDGYVADNATDEETVGAGVGEDSNPDFE
jgi:hypothetical protein